MQIIISLLVIGLLWMIYDIINAPAVDEDEIEISADSEEVPAAKGIIEPIKSKKLNMHQDSEVDDTQ